MELPKTKKAQKEKCREILYRDNPIINEDYDFIMAILNMHPDSEQKKGAGVTEFYRDNIDKWAGRCFFLKRTDGTSTDFSFNKCIDKYNPETQQKKAGRTCVSELILKVRSDFSKDIHHHFLSYDDIFANWKKENPDADLQINSSMDNHTGVFFTNAETVKSFYDYHATHAVLLQVSKEEHKKIHRENLMNEPIANIECEKVWSKK